MLHDFSTSSCVHCKNYCTYISNIELLFFFGSIGKADSKNIQVTKEVFEASKGRLKVVGRAGVGVDNVDLGAATQAGTHVLSLLSSLFCAIFLPTIPVIFTTQGSCHSALLHLLHVTQKGRGVSLYQLCISLLKCLVVMQSGCLVVNAPTANTIAAAEHGIALIAALSRNVAQADASVKAGKWERTKFVGVSIIGKTLAIMGFGKVCEDPLNYCTGG